MDSMKYGVEMIMMAAAWKGMPLFMAASFFTLMA